MDGLDLSCIHGLSAHSRAQQGSVASVQLWFARSRARFVCDDSGQCTRGRRVNVAHAAVERTSRREEGVRDASRGGHF